MVKGMKCCLCFQCHNHEYESLLTISSERPMYILSFLFFHLRPVSTDLIPPLTTHISCLELDLPLHLRLQRSNLIRFRSFQRGNERGIPYISHLHITGIVRMDAVSQVRGSGKAGVLVNDPDGRCGGVEALRPGNDGFVQILNLGVVGCAQADGDYLCDLVGWLVRVVRQGRSGVGYVRRSSSWDCWSSSSRPEW